MKLKLRLALFLAAAMAAISAQAGNGFIFNMQVTKGRPTGGLRELRAADGRFFRIQGVPFSSPATDWNCSALGLGSPINLSHIDVRISGSRTSPFPITMMLFDHIAQRWVEVGNVNLPTSGLGEFHFRDRRAPERFVASNGVAKLRFVAPLNMTMVVDRITVRTVHN